MERIVERHLTDWAQAFRYAGRGPHASERRSYVRFTAKLRPFLESSCRRMHLRFWARYAAWSTARFGKEVVTSYCTRSEPEQRPSKRFRLLPTVDSRPPRVHRLNHFDSGERVGVHFQQFYVSSTDTDAVLDEQVNQLRHASTNVIGAARL